MLTVEEIKRRIIPVLEKYNVDGAVLFGSYAKGTAHEESDVDLLIKSKLKGADFGALKIAIGEALYLYDTDIFNTRYIIEGGRIDQEIKKYGILIYGRVAGY